VLSNSDPTATPVWGGSDRPDRLAQPLRPRPPRLPGEPEVQDVIRGAVFLRFRASYMTSSAPRTARRRRSRKTGAPHRAHPRLHLSDLAAWIGHARPGAGQSACAPRSSVCSLGPAEPIGLTSSASIWCLAIGNVYRWC